MKTHSVSSLLPLLQDPQLEATLTPVVDRYEINTPQRLAAFLATCHHETGGFRTFVENTRYSAERLMTIWPTRFTPETAKRYGNRPQAIANCVYANRMGNGSEATGDGWRYRGRGAIQITGYENYRLMSRELDIPLEDLPDYLQTTTGAIESAAVWWYNNRCNQLADTGDITRVTQRVNGGLTGLNDRQRLYKYYMDLFDRVHDKEKKQ